LTPARLEWKISGVSSQGLFGQDKPKVDAKKRRPGKVSAPKDSLSTAVDDAQCLRDTTFGSCREPRVKGACYPVPYGYDEHAFVTPCLAHSAEILLIVAKLPAWTEITNKDFEPLYAFLAANWPEVIRKHQARHKGTKP